MADPRYVSIVGGNDVSDTVLAAAERAGALLADAGVVVVTGGRTGVAEAASKGATAHGGTTVGILKGQDRSGANPYLTVAVATGLGDTRNALVAMNGEVVVAFDGAWGTLSEIAHAGVLGRPVVALGDWSFESLGPTGLDIHRADDPEAAVRRVLELLELPEA